MPGGWLRITAGTGGTERRAAPGRLCGALRDRAGPGGPRAPSALPELV